MNVTYIYVAFYPATITLQRIFLLFFALASTLSSGKGKPDIGIAVKAQHITCLVF